MPAISTTGFTASWSIRAMISCAFMMIWVSGFAGNKPEIDPAGGMLCNLSFPQAAIADVNTIYIPFTLVGQLIMVEAKVDTVTGFFMLDTGSEKLVLNKQYFEAGENGRAIAAVGNTGRVDAVIEKRVDSLQLDQLVVRDIRAHLVDLHHIELKKNTRLIGILGHDVYQDFEVFIDFQSKVIVLTRVNKKGIRIDTLAPYEVPYDSMDFDLQHHLIIVDARVNGVRLKMIMDSGAELNLIDRKVNRRVMDKFTIIKRVNLLGVGNREVEVLAGVMNEVQCGKQYSEKMNTLLTSLDEINQSFGVNVQGVLGYEFLKKRRVLINYQKRKLYFFNLVRS
jgi:hypothetical protein